jgi:4-hydroxythreonine-4-phosphate dehydrogenase
LWKSANRTKLFRGSMKDPSTIALSLGCPAGVGPEVSVSAAARAVDARVLLVGDLEVVRHAAKLRGVAERRLVPVDDVAALATLPPGAIGVWMPSHVLERPVAPGRPHAEAGRAQLAWIDEALSLVQENICDALVTGPVSKEAIAHSGARGASAFRGHTEHLARELGAREVVMAFHHEGHFTTSLVTTHVPLRKVPELVTAEAVATSAFWLASMLARLCEGAPRLSVAALNPHAGEGGLLGDEERERIAPGIAIAQQRLEDAGIEASFEGPLGAESAFRLANEGRFDGVVAMYHDQATIVHKLLGFGHAVNVTLGLPIVRTSVDHGTAYDIAGRAEASDAGMLAAIDLARRLTRDGRLPAVPRALAHP